MTKASTMVRKEKAGKAVVKRQKKLDNVAYEVRDNDVWLLSGPYIGKSVRELFVLGPLERDYLVNHLWFTNDLEVVKVIHSLCAK